MNHYGPASQPTNQPEPDWMNESSEPNKREHESKQEKDTERNLKYITPPPSPPTTTTKKVSYARWKYTLHRPEQTNTEFVMFQAFNPNSKLDSISHVLVNSVFHTEGSLLFQLSLEFRLWRGRMRTNAHSLTHQSGSGCQVEHLVWFKAFHSHRTDGTCWKAWCSNNSNNNLDRIQAPNRWVYFSLETRCVKFFK